MNGISSERAPEMRQPKRGRMVATSLLASAILVGTIINRDSPPVYTSEPAEDLAPDPGIYSAADEVPMALAVRNLDSNGMPVEDTELLSSAFKLLPRLPKTSDNPGDLVGDLAADIISTDRCSGAILRDPVSGEAEGFVIAKHCLLPDQTSVTVYLGNIFRTGTTVVTSDILLGDGDIAYLGYEGHPATEVERTLVDAVKSIDFSKVPFGTDVFLGGFPAYNNKAGEKKIQHLGFGAITGWSENLDNFMAAFGSWDPEEPEGNRWATSGWTCSGQESGALSLLYIAEQKRFVPVGPLTTRAEYSPVLAMENKEYTPEFGEELRGVFSERIGHDLSQVEYMCGAALPVAGLARTTAVPTVASNNFMFPKLS